MAKVYSTKLSGQHSELIAWMEAQPESTNGLILLALYTLKDIREGQAHPADGLIVETNAAPAIPATIPAPCPAPAPMDYQELATALAQALIAALPTAPTPEPLDLSPLIAAIDGLPDAVGQAVRDGLRDMVVVPTGETPTPERTDEDGQVIIDRPDLLDEMLAGMDSWMQ